MVDGIASLQPLIDGEDLLAGYTNSEGRDPDDLLPPLSAVLLPTAVGRRVLIGSCTCGVLGCGALAILVRRDRGAVVWSPAEPAGSETLTRTYRFALEQYLDAVDQASRDRRGEGRARTAARRVRLRLRDNDERYGELPGSRIDWVWGGRWGADEVRASISLVAGQAISEFGANVDEPGERFADRVLDDLNRQKMDGLVAAQARRRAAAEPTS